MNIYIYICIYIYIYIYIYIQKLSDLEHIVNFTLYNIHNAATRWQRVTNT